MKHSGFPKIVADLSNDAFGGFSCFTHDCYNCNMYACSCRCHGGLK